MKQDRIITVFGATGFLGRNIVQALASTGATLRIATRLPARAYFLKVCAGAGKVVPLPCSLDDENAIAAALRGADAAIYLPGILFEKGRNTFQRLHADAPARIAKICKSENVGCLVHVSALGASADAPSKYARSKAEGEGKVIHAFSRSVILRPSIVFGPGDNFFNQFARVAQISPVLPLIGGGKTRFQPVYVGDVARAVRNILADPEKHAGQIYELGGPAAYTFRELLDIMLSHTGQKISFVNLPFPIAKIIGAAASLLPHPFLTVDQVRSLGVDNVLQDNSADLASLGITPTGLGAVLPSYLRQYGNGVAPMEKPLEK